MCKRNILTIAAVAILALAIGQVQAVTVMVPIDNPGFEDPVLADGEYDYSLDNQGWGYFDNGGEQGSWNPGLPGTSEPGFGGNAPEGQNVGWTNPGGVGVPGGLAQVLTDADATLRADTTYTLTVEVGNTLGYPWNGYKVQLLAGGTPHTPGTGADTGPVTGGTLLAEDNNSLTIAEDTFETSTVTYTYDPELHSGLLGEPLQIRLLSLGNVAAGDYTEVNFENVTLSYDGPPRPPIATNPTPADGAEIDDDWVFLSWTAAAAAVEHDVYFGADFDDVNDATSEPPVDPYKGRQTDEFYVVYDLVPGTTYYWRIDEVNDTDPNSPWKGPVWSFMVPPKTAYNPTPADSAKFIDPNVELNWTGGLDAELHYVYFGDNFDDVNSAVEGLLLAETTYTPGTLELDKTYYWRVDESDFTTTQKGDVWSFKTLPDIPITDPNLVGWWTLDEGMGTTAVDWSGYNRHGTFVGDPQWVPGYDGGALEFDGSGDIIEAMDYKGVTGTHSRTVSAWFKTATTGEIISWGANTAGQKWIFRVQTSNGTDGAIRVEVNGGYIVGATDVRDDQWHHGAAVLVDDGSPDVTEIMLYLDGALEVVSAQLDESIDTASSSNVRIGQAPWVSRPFVGQIDDVRVYNKALTLDEIQQAMRGDPLLAGAPKPDNWSTPYIRDATPLSWLPGENASQHDVYFGTDRDAVADANASDTTGIYRGRQFGTSYTPPDVEWGGGPYYWRIDEYNTDATIGEGKIWSFTVADFIGIEDFEDYNDFEPDRIFDTWMDGWGVDTNGAEIGYADPNFLDGEHHVETTIVHGGSQSMPYLYENNFKYSEAVYSPTQRDWTEEGVGVLSLWFYGDTANAAERMYVALNGGTAVYNDNANASQIEEWTEWTIDLQSFTGVGLTNVNRIAIGFGDKNNLQPGGSGLVFFDDIRLYRPPELTP